MVNRPRPPLSKLAVAVVSRRTWHVSFVSRTERDWGIAIGRAVIVETGSNITPESDSA